MGVRAHLFLTSMSRTGTSLLYQLLFGHPDIEMPRYRIKLVCAPPFGFPLSTTAATSPRAFVDTLLSKTTLPVVGANTSWHNLETTRLSDLGAIAADLERHAPTGHDGAVRESALQASVRMIEHLLDLAPSDRHYRCLHDDHAYVLGARAFAATGAGTRIVATVRHPLDMLASKKNMLVFHRLGAGDPQQHRLTARALERELARALFSLAVASWEYGNDAASYPVVFEHLKGADREASMRRLSRYLEIEFTESLLSERKTLAATGENELMYAGSSLQFLTRGARSTTVGSRATSLQAEEHGFLRSTFDFTEIDGLWARGVEPFYERFGALWTSLRAHPVVADWMALYQSGEHERAFDAYSAFNYGRTNAAEAFATTTSHREEQS